MTMKTSVRLSFYRVIVTLVLLPSCGQLSLGGSLHKAAATPASSLSSAEDAVSPDGASAVAGDAVSGSTTPGAGSSKRAPHDRFAVLDLKIGMPLDGHAGFACTKAKEDTDRHCVKFLDKRCANQATSLGVLRYGEKAPLGCHFDYSSTATRLDDKVMQNAYTGQEKHPDPNRVPLINVHLVGTQATPSKIYRIVYTLAVDDLEKDSKLYRGLVEKYGEPTEVHGWVRWRDDTTELRASCEFDHCIVDVTDSHFEEIENRRQKEIDDRARHQSTSAPSL